MKSYNKKLICIIITLLIIVMCEGCSEGKPDIDLSGLYIYSLHIPKEGDTVDLLKLDRDLFGYPSTLEIIDNETVLYDDIIAGSVKQKNGKIIIYIHNEEYTYVSLEKKVLEIQSSDGSLYKLNQIDKSSFDRYMYRDTFTHKTLSVHPKKGDFEKYNTENESALVITSDYMMVYIQSFEKYTDSEKNKILLQTIQDGFFVDPAKVEMINNWDTYFYEGEGAYEGMFIMDCMKEEDNYVYVIRMAVEDKLRDIDDENIHKIQISSAQSNMIDILKSITFSKG